MVLICRWWSQCINQKWNNTTEFQKFASSCTKTLIFRFVQNSWQIPHHQLQDWIFYFVFFNKYPVLNLFDLENTISLHMKYRYLIIFFILHNNFFFSSKCLILPRFVSLIIPIACGNGQVTDISLNFHHFHIKTFFFVQICFANHSHCLRQWSASKISAINGIFIINT